MGSIAFGNVTLSGQEFQSRVLRAAAGLAAGGVERGDGVAIMLRNEPGFIEASIAAGMLGAYPVPINWHAMPADLSFILEDSGAKLIVIHSDLLTRMRDAIPPGVQVRVVRTPPEIIAAYGLAAGAAEIPAGVPEWAEWRDSFAPRTEPPELAPTSIFYTSGTTGRPKGVKRPQMTADEMGVFSISMARSYGLTGDYGAPDQVVTVVTGPMYHGLPNGSTLFSFRAGASLTIMPRFDPEGLLKLIEAKRVTHLNMVPIMFNRLLRLPEEIKRKYDLSSIRYVAHAAAPISPAIKRDMIEWWGPVIHEYYGSTETANVAFCTPQEWLAHPGTVGKAAPGTDIRIVDDHGKQLPAGQVGHIVCRINGFSDMTYLHNEAARKNIELAPGMITAGDIGYLDDDGFLFISDRSKDMIISGGVNIYPAEIEGVLQKMPGVADCAVFGIPNKEFGEAIHAVVQKIPGATLDAASVQAYLRERIPGYMVPRSVEFALELPREDSGKLFKRRLREPFWAAAGRTI